MKRALSILALASLAACGGGGGGSGGGSFGAAPAPAPVAVAAPEIVKPLPLNPNCVMAAVNHMACDLIASDVPIGVGAEPGVYVTFTNRTGTHVQVNEITADTGERRQWSEFCAYLDDFVTGQHKAGSGEVGCSSRAIGEEYPAITFGERTGLAVAPGGVVYLASHSQPTGLNHTYSLKVSYQTSGLTAWRQPQHDKVFACDGQWQSTVMSGMQNTTGRELRLTGVAVYAESGTKATPHTLAGAACIYVLNADGTPKYSNCDPALRTRGDVSFPAITIAPGEFIAAQAVNFCSAPAVWGWAAWLRVW